MVWGNLPFSFFMASNFIIGDLVSRLNIASYKRLVSIKVLRTQFSLALLDVLWKQGVINGFTIRNDSVLVFLKYRRFMPVLKKIKIVSRPGKRVFWSLSKLSLNYRVSSFAGFFIISTSKGLITSSDCLLGLNVSGEVILQVST